MSFREHPAYPVVYMFAVTLCFAAIVVGISRSTAERVEVNRRIMFERAVLMALPLDVTEDTPGTEVHRIFVERVREPDDSSAGAYRMTDGDRIVAYALPIRGRGFWDEIAGVIGIDADRMTLTGIAFHQQKETPGLGAEIVKPEFRAQFAGKKMSPGDRPIGIVPAAGALAAHEVHAVTGATQTCTRVERILNDALREWRGEGGGS